MQELRNQFTVLAAVGLALVAIGRSMTARAQSPGRVFGTVYLNNRPVGKGDARVYILDSEQGDSLESCLMSNGSNFEKCIFLAFGDALLPEGFPTDSGGGYSYTADFASDGTYWFVAVYRWGDMSSRNPIHALKFTAVQTGHVQELNLFMPGSP